MEEGKRAQRHKSHCLIFPYPLQGHVNPMLQFSKRLEYKGVNITVITTKSFFKRVKDASSLFAVETISDGFDEGGLEQAGSVEVFLSKFQQIGSETLSELLEKLNNLGCPVDCVVYDASLPWALDVANKLGIAGAVFFTQSCAVDNIYYHVYLGFVKIPMEETRIAIPGLPTLEPSDMPSLITMPQQYPAILDMAVNQFKNFDKAQWILVNTFYKLEEEVIDWMAKFWPVKPIGPTIPSMYLDKRIQDDKDYGLSIFEPIIDACAKWLQERTANSVVYVSFGSLASLDAEGMAELAWGLQMTEKYFLWVVRASEQEKLPKKFVEETSKKGLIVSWCPQLDVLANESIGCFVSHGGWNSTLEAMSLGVPMVVMPQWTDQSTNAKYLMDVWKMGIRAQPYQKGIVRKEVINNCIRQVMEGERGEGIRANAAKWKELAREAMDEGGSSDKNIDEFVSKLSERTHIGR